ncbi:MAG TPA: bifunctional protein-serine/threonine kinase/phosphatase [Polyangiales bacterium]|nr:bifunctional protein-serine/threonine kinase/phosphatase [Polyangiales bacterium]
MRVSIGQCSDKGRKPTQQDFHGARVPAEPLAALKGICVALADGISSSEVSGEASEAAVVGFLEDYYCTSEAWSVQTSVERVASAANSWLHAQTLNSPFRYDRERGYVCTFSALVLKASLAHVFHVGDTRVYRVCADGLEQLTHDHKVRRSGEEKLLSRALGASAQLELDYRAVEIEKGSTFVLASDGVYEHVSEARVAQLIAEHVGDLDRAAQHIVRAAYDNGSADNLTLQVVRVESLASQAAAGLLQSELSELPLPPLLQPRDRFEGYTVVREIHASHRSHVYLAVDDETQARVVIKAPAIDLRADEALLERFLMEEWIARRIDSAHVLKPCKQSRKRNFVYLVSEYIEGQTLAQWMIDHPAPDIEVVRRIVEQVALGLYAFHKLEMVHQDLRPENILIDASGTAKIIDFGAVHVAGIAELSPLAEAQLLGTAQYTAPEYFLGEAGTASSDLYSLAVITYQLLSGRLPYGGEVSKSRTKQAQLRLRYDSVLSHDREIPAWVDYALRRALHPDPWKRYHQLSEFIYDLRHPSRVFLRQARPPWIERDPAKFWKAVSAILALIIVVLLKKLLTH